VLHKTITRLMKLLSRRGVLVEEEGSTYMADDRQALEQLCRYITRPALANERVQTNAAGDPLPRRSCTQCQVARDGGAARARAARPGRATC
jgi:hypothetical protein